MKKHGSILSSQGGVKYNGPVARKPDEPGGRRNQTSGSRPIKGFTSTPTGASSDTSGHLGRRVPGALKQGN